jgi:hypothetical protein
VEFINGGASSKAQRESLPLAFVPFDGFASFHSVTATVCSLTKSVDQPQALHLT